MKTSRRNQPKKRRDLFAPEHTLRQNLSERYCAQRSRARHTLRSWLGDWKYFLAFRWSGYSCKPPEMKAISVRSGWILLRSYDLRSDRNHRLSFGFGRIRLPAQPAPPLLHRQYRTISRKGNRCLLGNILHEKFGVCGAWGRRSTQLSRIHILYQRP